MLEKIKKLLSFSPDYVISRLKKKLETEDMDLIEEILYETLNIILLYIHWDKVPESLEMTLYDMAIDYQDLSSKSSASARFTPGIKSVQRGDVRTEFQDVSANKLNKSIRSTLWNDYAIILNSVRKLSR